MQTITRSNNIIQKFTPDDVRGNYAAKLIYSSGIVYPPTIPDSVLYDAEILTLRCLVFITSTEQVPPVIPEMTESNVDIVVRNNANDLLYGRFSLNIIIGNSYSDAVTVGRFVLNNRYPYYSINVLPSFSNQPTFRIGGGTYIYAEIADVGYGNLAGSDFVTFIGSVQENFYFDSSNTEIIINNRIDTDDKPVSNSGSVLPNNVNPIIVATESDRGKQDDFAFIGSFF